MELLWTFDYVKVDKEFEVTSSRQYRNGEYIGEVDPQEKVMLVGYLALFPGKEIVRIKLGSSQNSLYTVYFFDKRFKDKKFIGVLSCAEYNTSEPFLAGFEEEMMYKVFSKFAETFPNLFSTEHNYYELDELLKYYDWMDSVVKEYYLRWEKKKREFYGYREEELRKSLAETFSTIARKSGRPPEGAVPQPIPPPSTESPAPIPSPAPRVIREIGDKPSRVIKLDSSVAAENNARAKAALIHEITDGSPIEKKKIRLKSAKDGSERLMKIGIYKEDQIDSLLNIDDLDMDAYDSELYERHWQIQVHNEYGNPLTDVIQFIDGMYSESTEEDFYKQGLEAMSYSVLKTLVEQKNLNLEHIKAYHPGKGYEYIFFKNVKVGEDTNLLVIMSVMNYDKEKKMFVDKLLGGERHVLNRIAYGLQQHPEWFEKSNYKIKNGQEEVTSLCYRECRRFFKELKGEL